ncbi:WXG100 family type VII secretion target [Nocardia brasiliensis]|uniref:WXG100 family type VII secretion target n=1 Tax=Nocardia brasiliensis TaxID=37326 RepID=UPI0018949BD4|nr:WXG100 family type VII secretion target [Nocardia brasiliensis]MBF6126595.1 WXG100 family type VII secretion target [Nocardia brasiliensis]
MTETAPAFTLVPDEVQDAGRYIQQTATNLISGLRSASADVEGLMTSWRGNAARIYNEAWDETRTAALEVFDALADMAELLGVVIDRNQANDASSAATMSSLDLP